MTCSRPSPRGFWRLALLVLVLASQCLFAAQPFQPVFRDPLLESWRWRLFPELSGLGAQCMAEAKDRSLWFGTEDGVWSYDGFEWIHHPEATGATLSMGFAGDGTLWISSRFEIKQFKDGRWSRRFSTERHFDLRKLTLGADGSIWAATSWGLLHGQQTNWTLFTVPEIAKVLPTNPPAPAVSTALLPPALLAKPRTNDLADRRYDLEEVFVDHQGRIWAGTTGGEMLRFDPAGDAGGVGQWAIFNELDGLACGRTPSGCQLRDGTIWVVYGGRSGCLNVFDGVKWRNTRLTEAAPLRDCGNLLQTRDGTVWVAGRSCLGAFRNGRWQQTYQKPGQPVPEGNIFVFEASDGALWIGGPNTELQRVDYGSARWLSLCDLSFQWESPAGAEWFLHRDGRVVVHEPSGPWISYGVEDGVIEAPVLLLGTKSGEVWAAGSHAQTAATARFDGHSWTRVLHDGFSWGVDWRAAFAASDGSLWFGAAVDSSSGKKNLNGLLQFRDGRWIEHHQPGRFPPGVPETNAAVTLPATPRPESNGKFVCLGESRDGRIWAGRSALIVHDGQKWSLAANETLSGDHFSVAAGIHIGMMESFFTSKEGDLWIGTRQNGAVSYDGHAWRQFQGKDSLVANSVRDLTQTGDGSIWAATDRGVSRFDGQTWTAEVLPGALNIPEEGGSLKGTALGKIWVNRHSREWTLRAWPKQPTADTTNLEFWTVCHQFAGPPPHTAIVSGAAEVPPPGNLSIFWTGVAAWQEPQASLLQFSWRLDGGPWSPYTFEGSHVFFALPSGPHHFEVRARDRDFNVDPHPAALAFGVLPPVWQQAWFLALMAVLGGLLAMLSLRVWLGRARLREAHEHLSSLIGSVDGIVWEADPETLQFAFVSSQAERLLGYPQAQWSKEADFWAAHIHPDDRDRVLGETRQHTRDLQAHQLEYRFATTDGRTLWLRDFVTVVARNGRAVKLRGIMVDITAQKQAVEQLRASEERFRELADTIDEVFWITNAGFDRVDYVSPAYEKIWGRTGQSLYEEPQSWIHAICDEDRERVRQAAEECAATGKFQVEYRIRRPDGAMRWIFDHGIPVRNGAGQVERVVGVARDITENRQLGEQLRQSQKLEAIGLLAGGVAHDFNNILSAILMQTELLTMSGRLTGEELEGVRDIRADTDRAANLTRQLLLFSRKQMMQARNLDLNEVITGLAKMLQRIIGEDVRLQLDLHPAPLPIHADSGMLDQVLMNLAINARDAMPEGGRLTIETTETVVDEAAARLNPDAVAGHYACFSVSDTGCGIPAEVLPHIFEPFFTTKALGKGTGLGLATAFGIIKQHRGWIQLDSKAGVGTVFRVYLPVNLARAAAGQTASDGQSPGGTETILVTEDEPSVRNAIRQILERHGYKTICAGNGEEALQAWKEHHAAIALLLTDVVMPGGMSGQQLARILRANQPALKVIYVSGYSGKITGQGMQIEPGEHFLQKPFPTQELLKTIRQALDARPE